MWLCPGGGRVCISNQHFPVVVPQPIGFCILKKQANCSTWFIFSRLILHFLLRCILAKCSFRSSIHSQQSCRSGRLMKTGPLATRRKIEKLIQQTFREEYRTNIHVLLNLHFWYTIIWWCKVFCVHFSVIHVSMYYVVDVCSVHWFVIKTCASRLESYYYT